MTRTILIVTSAPDEHSDFVESKLRTRGGNVIRLNTDQFPNPPISISLSDATLSGVFQCSRKTAVDLDRIHSAWFRRPILPDLTDDIRGQGKREFAADELFAFLEGLWKVLNCYWVSPPNAIRNADNKIYQLRTAQTLGFEIPRTIITSNPVHLREFVRNIGDCVVKTLERGWVKVGTHDRYMFTNRLTIRDLKTVRLGQKLIPSIVQEEVQKSVELRITVVGDEIFTAEIHSQDRSETRIDWRHYEIEHAPHFPHKLPSSIRTRCLKLIRTLGLRFGGIDMILTPEGRYVFLEINPVPQWLWVEELAGLPISDALVELLLRQHD